MHLLPRSLFWRLMLVLILGLVLAQVVGSIILLRDRGDVLQRNLGMHLANRITAVVRLVEQSPPRQREDIIKVFDTPDFRVSLSPQPRPQDENAISPLSLQSMLRRSLPGYERVLISIIPMAHHVRHHAPAWRDRQPGRLGREPRPPWFMRGPPHVGFQAQVQISSGEWVIFQRPVPGDIANWRANVLTYLAILVISIALVSYIAVRYVTRPLGLLANAADDLGRNIQSPPLEETGPAEVGRAARAFNKMQRRLRRYIEDRGEILAAVSHDLKTPITRMRLRTEMLEQEQLQDKFNQDLDDMEQMVHATLDFMRGTESSETPVPIDIMALLEALQEDMRGLGHRVELKPLELKPYTGRPLLLKRCLTNLVENAVRYGEEANIRLEQDEQRLQIIIADRGPGIPEAERERVFRPFIRGEESRSRDTGGTGLGLSIARNIARAHGGELSLRSGSSGVGLEVVLSLPLA
jgi:signal transduction histidine kinase